MKRGPVGVIVSTMNDAFETGKSILGDLNSGVLQVSPNQIGKEAIFNILKSQGNYCI